MWAFAAALVLLVLPGLAAEKDADKTESTARRKAMLAAGRAGLCRVHYYFQQPKDEKIDVEGDYMEALLQVQYRSFIDRQMSLLTVGLLLDDQGHVLVGDMNFEDKYIQRIEVLGPDGTRYPAVRDRLLDRCTGEILKINEPLKNWKPPAFMEKARIEDGESLFTVSLNQSGREWRLLLGGAGPVYSYSGGDSPDRYSTGAEGQPLQMALSRALIDPMALQDEMMGADLAAAMSKPSLLCDDRGRPIGAFTEGTPLEPDQKAADWQQQRLLTGPAVPFEEFRKQTEKCEADYGKRIYKCKILYRQKGAREDATSYRVPTRRGGDHKEWTVYGLAVSPTRLLVPQFMDRNQAAKIERIEITVGDEKRPGEFVGAFKEVGAFLLELKKGQLPDTTDLTGKERPERVRLFYTLTATEKFGKKHLEMRPNRWLSERRGYKDLYYITPMEMAPEGAFLLDRNLAVCGVYARQRMEGEEIGAMTGAGRVQDHTGLNLRIFWTPEIAAMLADPQAHFDPQIHRKSEEEAKRLPWVGVEFAPVTPELAKQIKVEKQTKDGTIGLYVNRIYKGSPAEKLGIQLGDIVLRIKTAKRPDPIELRMEGGEEGVFESIDWTEYADYDVVEEYGAVKPRWKLRLNLLTILLKTIGVGEKIELTWLHDGKEISKDYTIEMAPPDFLSAKKYKNQDVGLTVKDLTYEVRAALRLPDTKKAVVVAKIEPGSPAQVARLAPFELISAMDGAPVGSADEFGKIIDEALKAKKRSIRLTIEMLGQSRLADLDISQVKAAPKENDE